MIIGLDESQFLMAVTCQNIGCSLTMKRYQGLQHKYVCLQRISDCPNQRNGCKFKQNKPSMERHVMSCPFRLVQCDICGKMKIFKDFDDHLKRLVCFVLFVLPCFALFVCLFFFILKWCQLCSGPSFTQGWKDIGAKTYLFTACANCYLRF
jgi:hypothetical protein